MENILEEYKILYENSKRDADKFLQIMLTLQDVISNMKDLNKNLQDDNRFLRTQLTLLQQQRHDEDEQLPQQISTFIDIIQEEEREEYRPRNQEIPRYSIPPHIRQVYLQNLGTDNNTCSICLSPVELNNTMELTECGHIFHVDCIRRHRGSLNNNNNNCPVCRSNL